MSSSTKALWILAVLIGAIAIATGLDDWRFRKQLEDRGCLEQPRDDERRPHEWKCADGLTVRG